MFAVKSEPEGKQRAAQNTNARQIVIQPTTARHAEQMNRLSTLVYSHAGYSRVAEFKSQAKLYPEGQFVAIDTTDPHHPRVVGYTSCMRLQFNPAEPLLESWSDTTGYG
ncbi:MAG: hypothetical protein SGI73_08525 [Chloroflexota bacterium]|nr:hypothetical protein [Chloroflexota bacterium]